MGVCIACLIVDATKGGDNMLLFAIYCGFTAVCGIGSRGALLKAFAKQESATEVDGRRNLALTPAMSIARWVGWWLGRFRKKEPKTPCFRKKQNVHLKNKKINIKKWKI